MKNVIQDIIDGKTKFACFAPDETQITKASKIAILPGSFNPFHAGHYGILKWAFRNLEVKASLACLSITNCDKGSITIDEITNRIKQFHNIGMSLLVDSAPNFVNKSWLYTDSFFLVGADTICRIGDKKYACNDDSVLDYTFERINTQGCKFVVFERNGSNLENVDIPDNLRKLCINPVGYVPNPLSSSQLRAVK